MSKGTVDWENSISCLKSFSLFFSVSFFESLSSPIKAFEGRFCGLKVKATATTGPNHGPRPASSTQILYFLSAIKKISIMDWVYKKVLLIQEVLLMNE